MFLCVFLNILAALTLGYWFVQTLHTGPRSHAPFQAPVFWPHPQGPRIVLFDLL